MRCCELETRVDIELRKYPFPWRAALAMRGADHDDVLGDDRRGMQSDLGVDQVEAFLIEALLQIDHSVGAE